MGYYNASQRPDIHGIQMKNPMFVVAQVGTYCRKCGQLCDYKSDGIEYYTNGMKKSDYGVSNISGI